MKGGREGRDIDAITMAQGVEALGAGEIMLNCIDRDGTNSVSRTPPAICQVLLLRPAPACILPSSIWQWFISLQGL